MIKYIIQVRKYYPEFTESELFIPEQDARLCWVLEDKQQPHGVKVDGKTCLPEGIFDVAITFSNRFQKDMIQLFNQPDMTVQKHGIKFTGARVHGGNSVDDSDGCPLVNKNTDHKGKQWGSYSAEITILVQSYIKFGHRVRWMIVS